MDVEIKIKNNYGTVHIQCTFDAVKNYATGMLKYTNIKSYNTLEWIEYCNAEHAIFAF